MSTALRAPRAAGPTHLRTADLLRVTDTYAAAVLDGDVDHVVPRPWPTDRRWFARLHSDDALDVWLISWATEIATELHDHAGSFGAMTVVSGALTEHRWVGHGLRTRTLVAGDQAAFPLGWVHDVVGSGSGGEPTLSVHAYSPPLTAMSYYEVGGGATLRRTRSVLTDHPEQE